MALGNIKLCGEHLNVLGCIHQFFVWLLLGLGGPGFFAKFPLVVSTKGATTFLLDPFTRCLQQLDSLGHIVKGNLEL
jgi:hypothetical protein